MLKFLGRGKTKQKERSRDRGQKDTKALSTSADADNTMAIVISKPEPATESTRPVLEAEDEAFLKLLTAPPTGTDGAAEIKPPLPPRSTTPELTWDEDSESFRRIEEPRAEAKKSKRLSIFTRKERKPKDAGSADSSLAVPSQSEVERERDELTSVLDHLNLASRNNKVFSLSTESAELVRNFTLVLKDLVNGVPTAANDLRSLLQNEDSTLAKSFDKLPNSFKKLVTQLPDKLSGKLGPEILAIAAEAQGLSKEQAAAHGGLKGATKNFLMPKNMADLVSKPGAVVGMLKAIMNALKTRFPAFIGTNMLWSVAVFLLLIVLWYCHKRGREVRLEQEKSQRSERQPSTPVEESTSLALETIHRSPKA